MAGVTFCDAGACTVLVAAHDRLASVGRQAADRQPPRARSCGSWSSPLLDAMLLDAGDPRVRSIASPSGREERMRRDHGNVALGRKKGSPVPIDKRVSGTTAEIILRRASTNGETNVVVVGDFNDWSPGAHPMPGESDGWTCTVTMAVGRRYGSDTSSRANVGRTTGKRRLRRQRPRRPGLRRRPHRHRTRRTTPDSRSGICALAPTIPPGSTTIDRVGVSASVSRTSPCRWRLSATDGEELRVVARRAQPDLSEVFDQRSKVVEAAALDPEGTVGAASGYGSGPHPRRRFRAGTGGVTCARLPVATDHRSPPGSRPPHRRRPAAPRRSGGPGFPTRSSTS